MPITDTTTRSIKCDNAKCDKEIIFDPQNQEQIASLPDWMRTLRSVNLGNGAKFFYCSDICEVEGVTTGNHNIPEPPKVQAANAGDVKKAVVESKIAAAMKTPGTGKGPILVKG